MFFRRKKNCLRVLPTTSNGVSDLQAFGEVFHLDCKEISGAFEK